MMKLLPDMNFYMTLFRRPRRLMARSCIGRLPLLAMLLAFGVNLQADQLQCRPYELVDSPYTGPSKFSKGLLWEVSREGRKAGHLFGTIHVDDEDIVELPEAVKSSLNTSKHFVMEALPSPEDMLKLTGSMFFMDGNRLDGLVPANIFERTVAILKEYNLPEEIVAVMKPWAAYITMSYPQATGTILDLKLLQIAQQNGARVSGLESVEEQIDIFSEMSMQDQLRLLVDVVCHYDTVNEDFEKMKSLYIDRDLEGLYVYGQRYIFEDNTLYENIAGKLIQERNRLMTERIGKILDAGDAFIAVGAMHLPGDDGILNLLEKENYTLTRIY